MCSGQVDGGGGQVDTLPADWRSERFRVVDAGNGKIALHSGTERRFLRAEARNRSLGVVDVSQAEKAADELPPESEGDWAAERFVVVPWVLVRPKQSDFNLTLDCSAFVHKRAYSRDVLAHRHGHM